MKTVQVTLLRKNVMSLLNPGMLVVVSNDMQAVKLCSSKILQS